MQLDDLTDEIKEKFRKLVSILRRLLLSQYEIKEEELRR